MKSLARLHAWFYRPQPSMIVAGYRIALGILVLLHALMFVPVLRQFFTNEGYLPGSAMRQMVPSTFFSIFYFNDSVWFVTAALVVLCIAAILLSAGIFSQLATLACYILLNTFIHRFPLADYGGYTFLSFALFFTIFMRTDKALVPKWYARRFGTAEVVPGWPVRMVQLFVAFIYLISAFMKIRGVNWFDGTQLLHTMNLYGIGFEYRWLQYAPYLVALFTYGTIAAELSFPFLAWNPATRRLALIALAGMHVGIALSMNVTYLSETMLAMLILFIEPRDIADIKKIASDVLAIIRRERPLIVRPSR